MRQQHTLLNISSRLSSHLTVFIHNGYLTVIINDPDDNMINYMVIIPSENGQVIFIYKTGRMTGQLAAYFQLCMDDYNAKSV